MAEDIEDIIAIAHDGDLRLFEDIVRIRQRLESIAIIN